MEYDFKDQIIDYFNKIISYEINLLEYAKSNKIKIYINGNLNKGWKGNVIEHMLNISSNNKKGSDYEDLEIKTVPIVKNNNEIYIKETTCLSTIDINSLLKQSFEDSDLLHKINKTLFILINVSEINNPQIYSTLYVDFSNYEYLLKQMKKDYDNLVEHVLENISNGEHIDKNFSGKLGEVIQPRPKTGKKGEYSWAFYLKKNVLQELLNPKKIKFKI